MRASAITIDSPDARSPLSSSIVMRSGGSAGLVDPSRSCADTCAAAGVNLRLAGGAAHPGRVCAEEERHPGPVHHDRQQHHQARDGEEPLGAGHSREDGKQAQQERADAAGAEERDEAALAPGQGGGQEGEQDDRAPRQRHHGEQEGACVEHFHSGPDERGAERHVRQQQQHQRGRLAVLQEAVAQLQVLRAHREAGRKRRHEPASAGSFRHRIGHERERETVERLIVAPYAAAGANPDQRDDPEPADQRPDRRAEEQQAQPAPGETGSGGAIAAGQERYGYHDDRQQHDVVHAGLEPERDLRRGREHAGAQNSPKQDRIRRCQRRPEDRGRGRGETEQKPAGERRQRSREQGPGSEQAPQELPVPPDVRELDRDGVAEEHQHQAQRGEHPQHGGIDADVDQAEPRGAKHGAQGEEQGGQRHAGTLEGARRRDAATITTPISATKVLNCSTSPPALAVRLPGGHGRPWPLLDYIIARIPAARSLGTPCRFHAPSFDI